MPPNFHLIPKIDKGFVVYCIISFVISLFIGLFTFYKYGNKNRHNNKSTPKTPPNSFNPINPNTAGIHQKNDVRNYVSHNDCEDSTNQKDKKPFPLITHFKRLYTRLHNKTTQKECVHNDNTKDV